MAKITLDSNWVRMEQSAITIPRTFVIELRRVLAGEMKTVRQALLTNVSGGVLQKRTGNLAKSIRSTTRLFNGGSKVWARAGSKYYVGRFWEKGFTRRGKMYPSRVWAGPIVEAAARKSVTLIEETLARTIRKGGI